MKDLSLLVWLTQLGLSAALPLAGFVLLGVWLYRQQGWGVWAVIAGVVLGIVCAIEGLRSSLKAMQALARDNKKDPPPVSFNDHD